MAESTLKERTAKGLFWGGVSNGIMQLLGMVFGIILARLLSPSDYGMVGMLAIFSALATVIPDSGFGSALINRKEIDFNDYNAVFWFNIIAAGVCYLILFFCAPAIARFYHTPELVKLARWSFLGFLIASFGIAPLSLLIKQLKIRERAISEMVAMLISSLLGLWLAFRGYAYWTFVIQGLVFAILRTLLYWLFANWRPSFRWSMQPIREMFGFGSRILITRVFDVVNGNFFSMFLGRLYSQKEVGYYNQANKWNDMSSSIIKGMIGNIAQPVMVEVADNRERQLRVFRKMVRFTAFVSFPAMLGLAFIAEEFITIALTDKWLESAHILQVLCAYGAFIPIFHLFIGLILSKGKSRAYMWSFISLCLVLLTSMLVVYPFGIKTMVITYTVVNILWIVVWYLLVRREIGYRIVELLSDLLPFLGIIAFIILGVYFVTKGIDNIYLRMVAKIALTAALYIFVMWASGAMTFRESVDFLISKLWRGRKNRSQNESY